MSLFDSLQMCKYRLTTWTVQLSFEVSSVEYLNVAMPDNKTVYCTEDDSYQSSSHGSLAMWYV